MDSLIRRVNMLLNGEKFWNELDDEDEVLKKQLNMFMVFVIVRSQKLKNLSICIY